jgi:hypothetical protein
MSESLFGWLNNDLRISSKVTEENIDIVFRNGYLLGEVLAKLKLDRNTQFIRNSVPQAIIQNFINIEKTLRSKLGMQIPPSKAVELINGAPGVTLQVLYQIKSAFDEARIGHPTPGIEGILGTTMTVRQLIHFNRRCAYGAT